jgi:capsular polysaccharide biosynthesis protein
VNDPDQMASWLSGVGDDPPRPLTAYEDSPGTDDSPVADAASGLVSLGFIGAALRRGARLWCALAIVGLVLGAGWYVKFPGAQKATVSVLLVDNPNEDPASEVETDVALLQSTPVASAVVSQLRLDETPSSFAGSYTVTQVSEQVLMINVSAPSSDAAVQRAAAVATQFLKFRAQYTLTQQQQQETELNQQINQAQQHLNSINQQISQVSSQSSSSQQQADLSNLQAQSKAAATALAEVREYVTATLASTRTATQAMVQGSQVLDQATVVKKSHTKTALLYAGGGLLGGLVLGMVIVVVGAITSDRLRRRDDIAYAIGVPVGLSVGRLTASRWLPDVRGRGTQRRDMDRVVEHLRKAVPGSSRGPAGLAVVAVDNAPAVAQAVVALVVSCAKQRWRVALADLSVGGHAARLLGADRPGISTVGPEGAPVVVVVPGAEDIAPVGPLRSRTSPDGQVPEDGSLAAACARADLVLSLVTLDPAFGGEHLATWAAEAVAVVTAGESTSVRIRAVGEMVRLAGTHLGSVVVIDADRSDESLGATSRSYEPASR